MFLAQISSTSANWMPLLSALGFWSLLLRMSGCPDAFLYLPSTSLLRASEV